MTEKLLELKNITTTVNLGTPEQKDILKNLSVTVHQGDFITLLGTNGAGKSTLFNVINGSLIADQGKVILLGKDITKMSETKRSSYISQVFQDPKLGTAPRMTVAENLLLALKRGSKRTLRMRNLKSHIQDFKDMTSSLPNSISDRLDTFTGNLSGGQRQTLSFLMATIKKPNLLLLDEHTAALDPNTSQQLLELTDDVVKEQKLTCIMITHKLSDALKYGNRTIILNDGKIVLDATGSNRQTLTEEDILQYFS